MCGFAGFLRAAERDVPPGERRALLLRMGRALAHRGPDDEQIYDDGTLAFVFRRLAIVDVAGGAQPLTNECGTVVTALNGEIYNHVPLRSILRNPHRFATASDAEICVHLFEEQGAGFLSELNGIFSLLVWDRPRQRLLLARDRLGVKPLYWVALRDGILFGSELKALLVHPECPRAFHWPDLDLGFLEDGTYTSANYRTATSFVAGVHLLHGGCKLTAEPRTEARVERWWSLEASLATAASPAAAPEEYVEEYRRLLADSVRLQLMSDVPIGAFLSGGLDSATLVAAAASEGQAVTCFSVAEPATAATGDLERAHRLTAELGLPLRAARFASDTFAAELGFTLDTLEYLVWMIDAPRFAPESFFKHELHRFAATHHPEVKVILLGQGADEFAGGYSRSFSSPRPDWESYVTALGAHHRELAGQRHGIPAAMRPLLPAAVDDPELAPFQREMLARVWSLQSHNLWNEDRVAASQGIEARVPFLDHRLVELLAAIPPALHPTLFFNKAIVRAAAGAWLGPRYTAAPKVLFWQAEDPSSVHRLMAACLARAYPAFRERYGERIFSRPALDGLARDAQPGGPDWTRAVRLLLAAMVTTIFQAQCEAIASDPVPVRRLTAPSPLAAWEAAGERSAFG